MSRIGVLTLAALALAFGLAAVSSAAPPPDARLVPGCLHARDRLSACRLVADYFDAIDQGRFEHACSLLGVRLRRETGGAGCGPLLAMAQGAPHAIAGVRRAPAGIVVLVDVGLHELDHYRTLRWAALVGRESGGLRILATRRV